MLVSRGRGASEGVVLAGVDLSSVLWGDLGHELYHRLASTLG